MTRFCFTVLMLTSAAMQSSFGSEAWRAEAEARIAKHRTRLFSVVVRDERGVPMPGVDVQVQLVRHAFLFGTQVSPKRVAQANDPDATRYRQETEQRFDTIVMGNEHKMAHWQNLGRRADAETVHDWAQAAGLRWRGHALIWGVLKYRPVLPEPFHSQMKNEEPIDREALLRRIDASIIDRMLHRKGTTLHWDVVNEPISEPHLFRALGADTVAEQATLLKRWFDLAHRLDPAARLYLNEFGILVTQNQDKRDRYFALAKAALDLGAPIHGIGFQCHVWDKKHANPPATLLAVCDQFATLGVELCITEYDTFGPWGADSTEAEAAQATQFEEMLTTFYSHPAASGFLVWGIWDGGHWKDSSPFFRKDWSEKPALAIYDRLVRDAWATQAEGQTGPDGIFSFIGHHGRYAITLRHHDDHDRSYTVTAELGPDSLETDFTLPDP